MTVRFLVDEDLDAAVLAALRSNEPSLDILDVKTAGLRGIDDDALLELAAQQQRVLITYDRNTMIRHARKRLDAGKTHAGLFILPQQSAGIRSIVESLILVWTASEAEEWLNQTVYLPFR